MLDAREIKNIDEIMLLNDAAAMVDGVYQLIYEALKPGVREADIVGKPTRCFTIWDPMTLRRSMRFPGSDVIRILTISPTVS